VNTSQCRYTLHDIYGSTAVNVTGVTLVATFVSPTATISTYSCPDPATSLNSSIGGDCSVLLPSSLFSPARTSSNHAQQFQAWLQLRSRNGTDLHQSKRTVITLHSKPAAAPPAERSGFMRAPYRHVYPGEQIRLAVFAHSGGQRAGGFQIRVAFDSALLSYSGYELPPAWRVCFFISHAAFSF
jgi:hypothetical protein